MCVWTLLREGRIAPPFASTKANLDEQRMRSRALLLPVQRFSNNNPVILILDLKLRFFFFSLLLLSKFSSRPNLDGDLIQKVSHLTALGHDLMK